MIDTYTTQARQAPALLTLFPVFITTAAWTPALYELATGLVGLAVACGVTIAFAHFARWRGRVIESRLLNEWGHLPTTTWMRRSDDNLDAETKDRYCRYLEENISGWQRPSADLEEAEPTRADELYESAGRWLREHSRNKKKFPLVFKENVSYGFRRNCLGLKPFAIAFTCAALLFGLAGLYRKNSSLQDILADSHTAIATIVVSFVLLLWWVFGVSNSWVKDGAYAYARALLSVCDE